MSLKEYKPGTTFVGRMGRTVSESDPAWPAPVRSTPGAPNVVYIVLDDTGFGQLGCYGSPIRTPNLDSLAEGGLRYNNMHTTALCSPSRSCILNGRNHHSNHMAAITEVSTGFPGYDGYIPFENGFLSEILHDQGYNTYAVGKWHLTPADQISAAGPYDRWPLGRGFDRYYGFLGGDTHQYYPELVADNHRVEPERTPEEGYHLTEDLVDKATAFIADAKQVAPNKPFFCYFATGAMHAPHHVPTEWADRYQGAFDDGWEAYRDKVFAKQKLLGIVPADAELSRHDPDVARWADCSPEEQRLYARMMEVFAGFLEHTDHHIGRLLDFLREIGEFDNTLIMVLSDNGASAEGGPTGSVNENQFFNFVPESLEQNLAAIDDLGGPKYFNHYPWGWTWAGNTPFRRWKRETYRGGISDPANVPSKHITQYFEMIGHRSIYYDGWRAVCPWPGPSFAEGKPFGTPLPAEALTELDATGWELYHVATDFAENHNLAADNRPRLIELIAQWYVEAGRYDVFPGDGRGQQRFAEERPVIAADRTRYTYYPGTQEVAQNAAPPVLNRPHSIHAGVEIPDGGAEGVLVSQGGVDGGFSFFVQGGRLRYTYNYVAQQHFHIVSDVQVPTGDHILSFEFEPTGNPEPLKGKGAPGIAKLFIDGEPVGQAELPVTIPL